MKLIFFASLLFLAACTTYPFSEGRSDYIDKIEQHSAGDKQFAGLYQNFEFRSTILTHGISQAIHDRLNTFYKWSPEVAQQKLQERMSKLDHTTVLWLSFFTPDRKNDNLSNKVSIWKVYLEVHGQRYEGHVYKANKNFDEAKALFPYHSRWATAYYVNFPVPTSEVENSPAILTITGPLGHRQVVFNN